MEKESSEDTCNHGKYSTLTSKKSCSHMTRTVQTLPITNEKTWKSKIYYYVNQSAFIDAAIFKLTMVVHIYTLKTYYNKYNFIQILKHP